MEEVRGKSGIGATMDPMELEREKGITIQSAATYCDWGNHAINLIDTPGHVDFTIEVERALRVLDGAILVLCGVAGVQSQSITVDRQMKRYKLPCFAFVNKCDRLGANPIRVCQDLRNKLGHNAVLVQYPLGLEDEHRGIVDIITMNVFVFDGEHGEHVKKIEFPDDEILTEAKRQREILEEALAELDDGIAELFLEGKYISPDIMYPVIRRCVLDRTLTPVFLGSAYKNKGIQPLLDGIIRYLPSPEERNYEALDQNKHEKTISLLCDVDKPLVMLAFKVEDGKYGQLTYCRIFQGSISKGDVIWNRNIDRKHKVGRLVRMHADQMNDIASAHAGDIIALFGIECASGDTFTSKDVNYTMTSMFVPDPVVTLAIEPERNDQLDKLSKALNRFSKEDPTFCVSVDPESGETIIGGMGELHLEVYTERMRREYNLAVRVGKPQVAYRETITRRAEFNYLHKKQTGGSGQYARVVGYIEPLEDGDSEFVDNIFGGAIPREFIPSCEKGFHDAMEEGGIHGYTVTGVRVVLNDGAAHSVDSSEFSFRIAAHDAFRQALNRAGSVILEPIMRVSVEVPEEFCGSVITGLSRRRGHITNHTMCERFSVIDADVPLAEMFGYAGDVRGATQGKAQFTMEFKRYALAT